MIPNGSGVGEINRAPEATAARIEPEALKRGENSTSTGLSMRLGRKLSHAKQMKLETSIASAGTIARHPENGFRERRFWHEILLVMGAILPRPREYSLNNRPAIETNQAPLPLRAGLG